MGKDNFVDFSAALQALKGGKRVLRNGWNGKNMFLFIVYDNPMLQIAEGSFDVSDYIAMFTAQKNIVPWLASVSDLLSEDWIILE